MMIKRKSVVKFSSSSPTIIDTEPIIKDETQKETLWWSKHDYDIFKRRDRTICRELHRSTSDESAEEEEEEKMEEERGRGRELRVKMNSLNRLQSVEAAFDLAGEHCCEAKEGDVYEDLANYCTTTRSLRGLEMKGSLRLRQLCVMDRELMRHAVLQEQERLYQEESVGDDDVDDMEERMRLVCERISTRSSRFAAMLGMADEAAAMNAMRGDTMNWRIAVGTS